MPRRWTVIMVVLVAVLAFSSLGFTRPVKGKRGNAGSKFSRFLERLKLSDEQVREIRRMQTELLVKNEPLVEKMGEDIEKLEGMVLGEKPADEKEVQRLIGEISRLRARILKNRLGFWVRFAGTLSPEQKKLLYSWLKDMRRRFRRGYLKPRLFLPMGAR